MKKSLVAVLATFALACLTLVGCGGSGAAAGNKDAFVGSWKLTGMTESGQDMSADDLATLEELGLEVTLAVGEDGNATLNLFGEEITGTWEVSGGNAATFKTQNGDAPMTLTGDKLLMEESDASLTFTKGEATASSAAEPAAAAPAESSAEPVEATETEEADTENVALDADGGEVTEDVDSEATSEEVESSEV